MSIATSPSQTSRAADSGYRGCHHPRRSPSSRAPVAESALQRLGWRPSGITYVENADAAHEVTSEIIDLGGSAFALQADVSDEAQVERLFREVDELGTLC